LIVEPVRGNLDTRLRKLRDGAFDAIVVAMAGLRRTGLFSDGEMSPMDPDEMLPAAGQGALCLQCRRDDERTRDLLSAMDDARTRACVDSERAIVAGLNGDCHSPIAALAAIAGEDRLALRAAVGAAGGGTPVIGASADGSMADTPAVVRWVLDQL